MPPAPSLPPRRDGTAAWIRLAFLLGVGVRAAFAVAFPTLHGGDAAARLANAETLVLGYQLPLPQIFVMAGKALHDDPVLVRLIFCVWGGVMTAGVTALLSSVADSRAGLFGAILLSFDPLLIHYSIVPYQEPVAYGCLAWAFYFALAQRAPLGACLMAAACLSRYEAWLFLPTFIWITRSYLAAILACLPVAGWILWWQGLAPRGLYVLDIDARADRFSRVVYLGRKFVEYETTFVVVLAIIALVIARSNPTIFRICGSLTLAMAVVIAVGHEYPPGSGLMSERLIHLPVVLILFLASVTLARLSSHSRAAFAVCLVATLLYAGRNLRFETALLRAAAVEPDLALARDVARALESNRGQGECVTVSAPRVDHALLDSYVAKVGAAFGDAEQARERAVALADTSPDRDRIAANLKAKPRTVSGRPGCPLLVLVDGSVEGAGIAPPNGFIPVAQINAGPRQARIFRKGQ